MTCQYCSNQATRNVFNQFADSTEEVCEIHYSYLKPTSANVNPADIGRCMRCGAKALNRRGDAERLVDHHVNYPLDLTVPVCDSCHQQIHDGDTEGWWLEQTERDTEPYTPIGDQHVEGVAIHQDYRDDRRPPTEATCDECGTYVIFPPDDMGHPSPCICPNDKCSVVCVGVHGKGVRNCE